VVHGEPEAAQTLADKLRQRFGWRVDIPEQGQVAGWPETSRSGEMR
jgi:hypothetical protein